MTETDLQPVSETQPRIARTEARAAQAMVTAKHPLVARLGLDVLRQGGNAVDAAVAMAFAIGVVEPQMSGLGGGGFMTVCMAGGSQAVIDYFARAPGASSAGMYELSADFRPDRLGFTGVRDNANAVGARSIAVPGLVSGLTTALTRYGSRPLAQLVHPAIELAERGYAATWQTLIMQASGLSLLRRYPATAETFLDAGMPYVPGDGPPPLIRQPRLAETLRQVTASGADGFYRGPVAAAITRTVQRAGGLLSEEDLGRYQAKVVEPFFADYRGRRLVAIPGASGGTTLLEILNILQGYDLAACGHNRTQTLHLLIEAARRGHADRLTFLGDPEQVDVPWSTLLSPEYAATRRATIDAERHTSAVIGDPWRCATETGRAARPATEGDGGCTTHLAAIDAAGNAVAVTQTLTSLWGSGVTSAETGVLLNNTMNLFNPQPGNANSVAPWKRPASSMAHVVALEYGVPTVVVGAPGGRRIMDTVLQVLLNVLDFGLGVQDAVAAPLVDTTGPETYIDPRIPEAVRTELAGMGHQLELREREFFPGHYARPAAILRSTDGLLHGGADPWDVGVAAGY